MNSSSAPKKVLKQNDKKTIRVLCLNSVREILIAAIVVIVLLTILLPTNNVSWAVSENPSQNSVLDPRLKQVCSCESWGSPDKEPRQFNENGKVLLGKPNPDDIGECQINNPTWGKKAEQLGYDIYTKRGNELMANWILNKDKRGIENWSWSKSCWK